MGLQTEEMCFPVVTDDGEISLPDSLEELKTLFGATILAQTDGRAEEQREPLFKTDFRERKGLETLFETGEFLKDRDRDFLPDETNFKIILPDQADEETVFAAADLAFRFGMDTTGIKGAVVGREGDKGNRIVFRRGKKAEMKMENIKEDFTVVISGQPKEMRKLVTALCNSFPDLNGFHTWRDYMLVLCEAFAFQTADGEVAAALERPGSILKGHPEVCQSRADIHKESFMDGDTVWQKVWTPEEETKRFLKRFKERVIPCVRTGDKVSVEGALSAPRQVRRALEMEMRSMLESLGCSSSVTVFNAYKAGYAWMREKVIPELKAIRPKEIKIFFKPVKTDMEEEAGATPSYDNIGGTDKNRSLDLPIRFLQELYPVRDDIISELHIEKENIIFEADSEMPQTYKVLAGGKTFVYTVRTSERYYLDAFKGLGKVHPDTGYLCVEINDEKVFEERIETDLEKIWHIYQTEVLPEAGRIAKKKSGGRLRPMDQPFFSVLRLDLTANEPEEKLGSRRDMISSLNSFHEDLYFAGTDYFKNLGNTSGEGVLDAPGLILPVLKTGEHLRFGASITVPGERGPVLIKEGKIIEKAGNRKDVSCYIEKITYEDGLSVYIRVEGVREKRVESYVNLIKNDLAMDLVPDKESGIHKIVFCCGEEQTTLVLKEHSFTEHNPETCDVPVTRVIGYEEGLNLIETWKGFPDLRAYKTARSVMGRQLYVFKLGRKGKGYKSKVKESVMRPTVLINARHHANEVSSTNAAFLLMKKLVTEERWRHLDQYVNLYIVPMENVDGTAIHYELQKLHPEWKYHVARFNALGKEFFRESYKEETLHREAMGFTRIYEKTAPDIFIDNHGVPSHEWEQMFSGYTSPSYKGFWLPRSLLYGYFWYVTDAAWKDNYALNKTMEDVVAEAIEKNEEMTKENLMWSDEFETYAHKWMPKLFPAEYYKNMINYWIPFAHAPEHRYPSVRYPWVTSMAYTSEVADETAQGDYLRLCTEAHTLHDEAMLEALKNGKSTFEKTLMCDENQISAVFRRIRPVRVDLTRTEK